MTHPQTWRPPVSESNPAVLTLSRSRITHYTSRFTLYALIPFNELNRVLDLGFPPLPWGDSGFVPQTLQNLGQLRAKSSPLPKPKTQTAADPIAALGRALDRTAASLPTPRS